MESSKLKINPDETYLIIIDIKQQRNSVVSYFPIKLLGSDTSPSNSVRNLDFAFDSVFNFRQRIFQVFIYNIRDLRPIRRHISLSSEKTQDIYSKLHFHHKSSVVPHSDNDFCVPLFTIMLNDYVLLRL